MFGSRVTTSAGTLAGHGGSEAYHVSAPPDVVVFPQSTDEVRRIVELCACMNMPMVAYGAGTSLEGNTAAIHGGVCLDFSQMNHIVAVHGDDLDVVVQPGITRKQLNAQLRDT
ncbi:MAG: FAD-binding protein, partial [Tardiphaga sp.]|nr:FAD-binding protein [Tardiphaga sp.]